MSAALADPRFEALRPSELQALDIEISVISPLEPIAPEQVQVGKHGLLVSRGSDRGVLLPQVAMEYHWNAERFLEETCLKAGLEHEVWKDPATLIYAFTAEVFSEHEVDERQQNPAPAPL
jgi:AmmeMemoRadiSam system protein A